MKCLDDCHNYELETVLSKKAGLPPEVHTVGDKIVFAGNPTLSFYRMDLDGTKTDGVTNEEVIRVLIHRLKYLNYQWQDGKFDCPENREAIESLEYALRCLENRTRGREKRGVEGTHEA